MYEKYEIVAWGGYLGGANTLQEAAKMALANAKLRRDIRCLAAGRFICKFDELGFLMMPIFAPKAEWEPLLVEQATAKKRLRGTIEIVCAAQAIAKPGCKCRPEIVLGLIKDKNLMRGDYDAAEYETADMIWMDWPLNDGSVGGDNALAWASATLGPAVSLECAPGIRQRYGWFADAARAARKMAGRYPQMRILRGEVPIATIDAMGFLQQPIIAVVAEYRHLLAEEKEIQADIDSLQKIGCRPEVVRNLLAGSNVPDASQTEARAASLLRSVPHYIKQWIWNFQQ